MPFYGARQAAALYAKYDKSKAKRVINQLKSHGTKKKARKKNAT